MQTQISTQIQRMLYNNEIKLTEQTRRRNVTLKFI